VGTVGVVVTMVAGARVFSGGQFGNREETVGDKHSLRDPSTKLLNLAANVPEKASLDQRPINMMV
jgi:hypothetical protein